MRPDKYPAIHAEVYKTPAGTPFLKEPGVALIGATKTDLSGIQPFLDGFDDSLGFSDYLQDPPIEDGAQLDKFAGQLCYMSLGENRTKNADAPKYFENIRGSGHGSVLEHSNLTFLLYGLSRSQTHELVRHRAGWGFSQVSQRYCDGNVLRFVERPEYVEDAGLHEMFMQRIDWSREEYDKIATRLMELQAAGDLSLLQGDKKRDLRKKVNQAARSCLPNETEAPIVITGNTRAMRHAIEMRASGPAETEIRRTMFRVFSCARAWEPTLFADYAVERLNDSTEAVATKTRKV